MAIELNLAAFAWGRAWAVDPEKLAQDTAVAKPEAETLDALVADRVRRLTAYQSKTYARSFAAVVERVSALDPDPLAGVFCGGGQKSLQAHGVQGRI